MSVTRVPKPWGEEIIFAHTDRYAGKILRIRAGESLSLQYHLHKDESIYLFQGSLRLRLIDGESGREVERRLEAGDAMRLIPLTRHRMEALTDCVVFEVSTPELDDVVRLEDRYGRV
ncbi:MAG: cupin [Acidobacteriota bacterium]